MPHDSSDKKIARADGCDSYGAPGESVTCGSQPPTSGNGAIVDTAQATAGVAVQYTRVPTMALLDATNCQQRNFRLRMRSHGATAVN